MLRYASGITVAARTARSSVSVRVRIAPCASITAEMPVLVARTCGRRVSTLRKAAPTRCNQGAGPVPNHASFDSVTMSSAPDRAAFRASAGASAS